MTKVPIIEVRVDDEGSVEYRIRTSLLSTEHYGTMLADLMHYIAVMLAEEGGAPLGVATDQILLYFNKARAEERKDFAIAPARTLQ